MSSDNTGMISEISQNLREDSIRGVQTIRGGIIVDNPSFHITIVKLDELNYLIWSRSGILSIQSRVLYSYLIDGSAKPDIFDPPYDKWIAENSLMMSWLLTQCSPAH